MWPNFVGKLSKNAVTTRVDTRFEQSAEHFFKPVNSSVKLNCEFKFPPSECKDSGQTCGKVEVEMGPG